MKVLFVTATRIGDAVLSTGIINHLVATYPECKITVACGPVAAPLFGAIPNVERVIPMPKKNRGGHWIALWRQTVGRWWDWVIDVRGSAIAYLVPTMRRSVIGKDEGDHRVERYANVIGATPPPTPRLWTADAHANLAEELVPDGSPVLAVGPTANWAGKQWRSESFVELIDRLIGNDGILPGARVALFGANNERLAAKLVIQSVPEDRRIDLVGKVDLLSAVACLKRCAFYVGNDSGLMHMAAASGLPTLGLFGPTREQWYAPWGEHSAVVRTDIPFLELFGDNPARDFDHRTTGTLMDSLSVDKAEEAARALWSRVNG